MARKVRKGTIRSRKARESRAADIRKSVNVRGRTRPGSVDPDTMLEDMKERLDSVGKVAKDRAQEIRLLTDRVRRLGLMKEGESSEHRMRLPPFNAITTYSQAYAIADLSPDLNMVFNKLQEGVFKERKWVANWTSKCSQCGTVFNSVEPYARCPICEPPDENVYQDMLNMLTSGDDIDVDGILKKMSMGGSRSSTMVYPDKKQYTDADRFFRKCNALGQTLDDIERTMQRDTDIVDERYYIMRWKYHNVGMDGKPESKKLVEVYRGDPRFMRRVVDAYNRVGGHWWKCIVHPDQVVKKVRWKGPHEVPDWETPACPKCGRPMHDVTYVSLAFERSSMDESEYSAYYIDGEVIGSNYYSPDGVWGKPPIIPMATYALTLMAQDVYMRDTFTERQVPQLAVWTISSNPKSAEARFNKMIERTHEDPTVPYHFIIESDPFGGDGKMGTLELMPKLHEMEYVPARNEMRNQICNYYGLFYNKALKESAGGVASAEPQLQVDPDRLDSIQRKWNNMREKLTKSMGVTDWKQVLAQADVKGVFRNLQIEQLEWQIAQMAQTVGYDTVRDVEGKLRQVRGPITKEDMGMLKDILMAIVGVDDTEPEFESNPSYDPSEKEPTGEPTRKEDVKKAIGDSTVKQMAVGATVGSAVGHVGMGSPSNPQSSSTYTPGTKEQYSKDGSSYQTKQQMGGALARKDNTPGNADQLKILVWYLLERLRMRSSMENVTVSRT